MYRPSYMCVPCSSYNAINLLPTESWSPMSLPFQSGWGLVMHQPTEDGRMDAL